jgi:hypothetical protein
VHLVVLGTLAVVLAYGASRLWSAARAKGDELAAQAARPTAPHVKATTTTSIAASTSLVGSTSPPSSAPVTNEAPITPAAITASSFSAPAANGCNQITSYVPDRMIDGDNTTAWRSDGDGTGQKITITLTKPTRVTQVGLLPGYARVDGCTKVNRFPQMRRVARVRWTFDKGAPVEQKFQDDPAIQFVSVDVVTATVVIEILATVPGAELDYTPISEVRLLGATG